MRRVEFESRRGGWFGFLFRLLMILAIWLPLPAGLYAARYLSGMANEIPELPDITTLEPTYGTRVERLDGARLGGAQAIEHVPFDDLPPHVVGAFMAAEDEDFFTHRAFSLRAIVRAFVQNQQAGRTVQGGSTITQQIAKQFMGTEKSYERKVRELLLARRLEATVPKTEILAIYLRTVFMGHTVYGVTQASWFYFHRDPRDLTLNQAATLAGLLPSPNRFDPIRHPVASKKQRDRVLGRLHAIGWLDQRALDEELASELEMPDRKASKKPLDPDALHSALTYLARDEELPDSIWGEGAHTLIMPHDPVAQVDARESLREAVHAYDRRQGWRGAPGRAKEGSYDELEAALAQMEWRGPLRLALIEGVSREGINVFVDGRVIELPLDALRWASSSERKRHYKRPAKLGDPRRVFTRGELVVMREREGSYELVQRPLMEGAFFALETLTGRVLASIGGVDPWEDEFHRAEQGCRQPGSVFKPVVYSEALMMRMSPATMVADVPREVYSERGDSWTPRNADRNYRGFVTLARALAGSRNIPTVSLMERVGARRVIRRARSFGISTPLDPVPALALGASCVQPHELIRGYAAFQRGGSRAPGARIETLIDARGDVVRDQGHFAAPHISLSQRLDRITRPEVSKRRARAMSEEVAFIMWWMLRQVATRGTAHALPDAWWVAGKTGTTNAFDTWFVGFDGALTAGVWVGSDRNVTPFGAGEHGATVAMPAFMSFYHPRAIEMPVPEDEDSPWPLPIPDGVEFLRVDPPSGLLAREGQGGVPYPFLPDTQPYEFAPTRGTQKAEQIDELLLEY